MAIITKQKEPFKPARQNQSQAVGNTYGARKAIQSSSVPQAKPSAAKAISARTIDKFSNGKKASASSLANFSPKASFQKVTGNRFSGSPHKPAALDYVEQGARPMKVNKAVVPPSDKAILNFLGRVIDDPSLRGAPKVVKKQA